MEDLFLLIIVIAVAFGLWSNTQKKKRKQSRKKYNRKKTWSMFQNNSRNEQPTYTQQAPVEPRPEEPSFPKKQEDTKEEPFDYSYMPYKKRLLLTKTEYAFYAVLMRECNKRKLLVCPKVRLEDIVYVTDKENLYKFRGYIKSRHVDFIITDLRLNTLAGIELDDPSHNNYKATKTDRFKNELFQTINVPLIRLKTGTDYATQLSVIFDNLNFNTNTTMTKTQP